VYLIIVIGLFAVLVLAVKVMSLRAQVEGFREAQRQANNYGNRNDGAALGLVRALAVIGLLALCALCLYLGIAMSALGD